ncbi:hypothetical protein CI109_102859 [Kwoniella shandongensis]|uniref:Uncharacterized protein n=1 Tax=Kwoniella shandongensis TaxID=1734106 RepID=A0A5M6C8H7_9TREE|nr:uncharacterized protein CI109_000049 [Kwoniella shandongensis]KAA5531211.1 hypothetical protein CI109_000049 [Kwoniella shandongensis]
MYYHSGPSLSPGTAKQVVEAFSHETSSSASESPDSLYSSGSPTFPNNPAFEYSEHESDELEHHEQDEYDAMVEEGGEADGDDWASPAWGRWPQSAVGMSAPGWSPSPRGSIISISPRGSFSGNGTRQSSIDRRSSVPKAPKMSFEERRDSNPSLLGFDLAAQRRRSSGTRSLTGDRRRSSVYSMGSVVDPIEDARLRNIASMELLRRRFSEVVEVTGPSSDEEEEGSEDHIAVARARMSTWSPYTDDSDYDEDDSEVHTAPYAPTPELQQQEVPTILSNFPLASVAHEPATETPSDLSASSSPSLRRGAPRFGAPAMQMIGTPPAPALPTTILRGRNRPPTRRSATNWEVPVPRTIGVPPGAAAPRPGLVRSASNPWYSAAARSREAAGLLEKRAAGSFPVARVTPLGVSPLRESLRRQSVVSDGEASRRGSVAERRMSLAKEAITRRHSAALSDTETPRRESLADRRMSLVKESVLRRMSGESSTRRSSKSGSRKSSVASQRKSSLASSGELRRPSKDSRKSSIVSIGEYGYLAPSIQIDGPATPTVNSAPAIEPIPEYAFPARLRRNAPPSIVLPKYTFPAHTSPTMSSYTPTPRFNPLESFFGRSPSQPSAEQQVSSPNMSSTGMLSPIQSEYDQTPHGSPKVSMINRGRPLSPPEFREPLPFRSMQPPSPKSNFPSPVASTSATIASPQLASSHGHGSSSPGNGNSSRKPVPKLSREELRIEKLRDELLRFERDEEIKRKVAQQEAALGNYTPTDRAILRAAAGHRRTVSIEDMRLASGAAASNAAAIETRPGVRRQATSPVPILENAPSRPGMSRRQTAMRFDDYRIQSSIIGPYPAAPVRPDDKGKGRSVEKGVSKRTSVTFADQVGKQQPSSPPLARPKMDRTSSFSRFFGGGGRKAVSPTSSPKQPSLGGSSGRPTSLKPALRPVSMDGSALMRQE